MRHSCIIAISVLQQLLQVTHSKAAPHLKCKREQVDIVSIYLVSNTILVLGSKFIQFHFSLQHMKFQECQFTFHTYF